MAVVHFNHRLRGQASDGDEQFVVELATQLQLPCYIGQGETQATAAEMGDGLEAAARQLRYEFFLHAAGECGARYVVTAHTADDQAETVLHHVLRGTGLTGLAGIPRTRQLNHAVTLIRPLLQVRRGALVDYLARLGQPYRDDASNADRKLTRNRLRHELLPLLAEQYNPQVVEALVRLGRQAGEAQQAIAAQVDTLRQRAVLAAGDEDVLAIDCTLLAERPRYLVRELLKSVWREQQWPLQSMGFDEWDLLAGMALGAPRPHAPRQRMFPGGVTCAREEDRLLLYRQLEEHGE